MTTQRITPASLMRRLGGNLFANAGAKRAAESTSPTAVGIAEDEVVHGLRTPCDGCEGADFTARLHEHRSDLAVVTFAPSGEIEYAVASRFPSDERRQFYRTRWLCTRPLFAAVKRLYPDLVGRANLWLDDLPRGSGLAFCGYTPAHVLIPDANFLLSFGYRDFRDEIAARWVSWRERRSQVFWRGSSTGDPPYPGGDWRETPRFKLCLKLRAMNNPGLFDVAISHIVQIRDPRILEEIAQAGVTADAVPLIQFMDYRTAIDIDGNSSSWPGLFTKLMMGNTIIKVDSAYGYRQWYYDRLLPWKNFLPVSAGMDELEDMAMWVEAHPAEAEAIAFDGAELAKSMTFDQVMTDIAPRIRDYIVAFGQTHPD